MVVGSRVPLSAGQRRVYDAYLVLYRQNHSLPPSIREIMAVTGLRSSSTVAVHLASLVEKGWLRRVGTAGQTRSIVPVLDR